GFLKKFIVEITGTANNTDGANAATLSDIGLANVLAQAQFIDTQSNTRIQTTGWHLDFLFREASLGFDRRAALDSDESIRKLRQQFRRRGSADRLRSRDLAAFPHGLRNSDHLF